MDQLIIRFIWYLIIHIYFLGCWRCIRYGRFNQKEDNMKLSVSKLVDKPFSGLANR